jgi:hypothetical protein
MHSNQFGSSLVHCGWRSSYCISLSCRTTTVDWLGFVFSVLLSAQAERSAASFENQDHVRIVIHNYRWRLGVAEGESKYETLNGGLSRRIDTSPQSPSRSASEYCIPDRTCTKTRGRHGLHH